MGKRKKYDINQAVSLPGKGIGQHIADVFILAGQSNMEGGGKISELPEENLLISNQVLFYNTDQFISPFKKKKFGPEIRFAQILSDEYPDKTIILCKVAKTGANLYWDWNVANVNEDQNSRPDGVLFVKLIQSISRLRSQLQSVGLSARFAAMFWMQGESDSSNESMAGSYGINLHRFIKKIREETGAPGLPFIIGQISSGIQKSDKYKKLHNFNKDIREHQVEICRNNKKVFMISTDALSLEEDFLHFDTQGQLELGKMFAEKYLEIVY